MWNGGGRLMSLANICIWLGVALVLVVAALWDMYRRWRKTLRWLVAESKENRELKVYLRELKRNFDVVCEQRDKIWDDYEKLRNSWLIPITEEVKK
jgi:hypothetical protein